VGGTVDGTLHGVIGRLVEGWSCSDELHRAGVALQPDMVVLSKTFACFQFFL